jgi:ribosomal protein L11
MTIEEMKIKIKEFEESIAKQINDFQDELDTKITVTVYESSISII